VLGLLHGFLVVPLGLSQHVTGIGVTLLATALSYYAYRLVFPEVTSPPKIEPFQPFAVPGLSDIPVLGPALFQQTPLTYLAFIMVGLVSWFLYRTPAGLAVRTVGENPAAAEAQGMNVTTVRMLAVMAGSALMGIGGSFITLSAFNSFFFEMTNGRGWICIALVVFGAWKPGKALLGAILFGLFRRLPVAPAAAGRCRGAVSAFPDAAVRDVDHRPHCHVAARGIPSRADGALPQGRTLRRPRC
jgi:ABC-type uncharacterized transport system permease subunit